MDKQKQIQTEELIGIIQGAVGGCATHWASLIAEEVLKYYQPKIIENAVVMTNEEWEKYQTTQRDWNAIYFDGIEKERKETAEKFAESLKAESDDGVIHLTLYEIDEICKEIIQGGDCNERGKEKIQGED